MANVVVGAAVGFVTGFGLGGLGALAKVAPTSYWGSGRLGSVARWAAETWKGAPTWALRGALTSFSNVIDQLAFNGIDKNVNGINNAKLSDGLALAAVTGFVFGSAGGFFEGLYELGQPIVPTKFTSAGAALASLWVLAITSATLSELADAMDMVVAVEAPDKIGGPRKKDWGQQSSADDGNQEDE